MGSAALVIAGGPGGSLGSPPGSPLFDGATRISYRRADGITAAVGQRAQLVAGRWDRRYRSVRPYGAQGVRDADALQDLFQAALHETRLDLSAGFQLTLTTSTGFNPRDLQIMERMARECGATRVRFIDPLVAVSIERFFSTGISAPTAIIDWGASGVRWGLVDMGEVLHRGSDPSGGRAFDLDVRRGLRKNQKIYLTAERTHSLREWLGLRSLDGSDTGHFDYWDHAKRKRVQIAIESDVFLKYMGRRLDEVTSRLKSAFFEKMTEAEKQNVLDHGCYLVGGVAKTPGLAASLRERLGFDFEVPRFPAQIPARGAALSLSPPGGL